MKAVSYGGTFQTFDDLNTPAKESINLNTLFPSGLVLGLDNNSSDPALSNKIKSVKLEVTDAAGKRDSVVLGGITTIGQRWKILPSQFDEVDTTKIVTISIVVEGQVVGVFNLDWGNYFF